MKLFEIAIWTEALASCAIEGNKTAQELLKLKDTDPIKFIGELEKFKRTHDADWNN